MARTEFYYWR